MPGVVESVPMSLAIEGIKCPRKAESRIGAPSPEMTQVRRRNASELWNPIAAVMLFEYSYAFFFASAISYSRITRNIFPFILNIDLQCLTNVDCTENPI